MLLIIDGNNLAHRVRHTFSLSNRGVDVSVTYGFLRVLERMLRKFEPQSVVCTWDGGTPEFRRQLLPEYKSGRDRGDPGEYADFIRQVQELSDYALPMMGVVSVRKIGAEADDLMYHASRLYMGESIIVTTDRDLLQAVTPSVSVYSPIKKELYTPESISNMYSVYPLDLVYLRALAGDSSDNIRGVPGIGMKTAIKLFSQYKSLSGIMNAALGCNPVGEIKGKLKENILGFGMDRLAANVATMALAFDRTGARLAVVTAAEDFQSANKKRTKSYLLRNAFVSLVSPRFMKGIADLSKPVFSCGILRTPVVCWRRTT